MKPPSDENSILRQLSSTVLSEECTVLPLEGERYVIAHEAFELASYQQSQIRHFIENEARRLVLSGIRTLRVLSVGCGSGLLDFPALIHLSDYIEDFIGVDPNPFAIRRCERTSKTLGHLPPCRFICSHFENFQNQGESKYDFIYCAHVLYYARDQKIFIESMLSLLRDHGVLVIAHAPREEMNKLAQIFWSRQKQADFYERELLLALESICSFPPTASRIVASIPRLIFSEATPQGELLLEFLIQARWSPLPSRVKRLVGSYIDSIARPALNHQHVLPHPATIFSISPT